MKNRIQSRKYSLQMILFTFIFFIFLIVNVSAQDVVIKQFDDHNLERACFNNGTFCSTSARCVLTILEPDGTVMLNNATMTNQETFHNYSISTTQSGIHKAIMSCWDGDFGEDTFDILSSPSGRDDSDFGYLLLIAVGGFFSIGMIIFGIYIKDPPLTMFGGILMFIFGFYMMFNGIGTYRNDLTLWSSVLVLGIGSYVSVRTGIEWMNV